MLPDSRPQELGVVANFLVGIVELVLLHLYQILFHVLSLGRWLDAP